MHGGALPLPYPLRSCVRCNIFRKVKTVCTREKKPRNLQGYFIVKLFGMERYLVPGICTYVVLENGHGETQQGALS